MTPQSGEAVDAVIEKMVYGGAGLARTTEGVVLVPLVLPGEKVSIELGELHKGVRHGRLAQVLEASPERISPACPYFGRCGGCHYQHAAYTRQLQLKQDILRECLERIGKVAVDVPLGVIAAEPWNYRNRARLMVRTRSGKFEIGYRELLSHNLCPIDRCPIGAFAIEAGIAELSQGVGAACFGEGDAEIELFASESGTEMLATVSSIEPPPPRFAEKLMSSVRGIASVCWLREVHGRRVAKAKTEVAVWGAGAITYHIGEFHYRVSHESFFQSNRFLLDQLIAAVVGDLKGKSALDLYAGTGLFSIPLAHRFEKVAAVESAPGSAADLASNLGVVSARARSYRLSADRFMATAAPGWEVIVADPPRSGLNKVVLDHIARLRPGRFVYVSCDPTTLARDIGTLSRSGFGIRSWDLIDLFPQTFHIETVVHMEPR